VKVLLFVYGMCVLCVACVMYVCCVLSLGMCIMDVKLESALLSMIGS